MPSGGDLRANIHVGGQVVPTELTPREQAIVAAMAPRLRHDGIYFVGRDLIGEKLTEVHVTSPTCFQEITEQSGFNVAGMFMDALERELASGRK